MWQYIGLWCRIWKTPQYTAALFNTLQHTAAHCSTLQRAAARCSMLQHTATHCNTPEHTVKHCKTLPNTATQQHTTTHYNTLQHTTTHCNTQQHTATHCNTLLHTTTRCWSEMRLGRDVMDWIWKPGWLKDTRAIRTEYADISISRLASERSVTDLQVPGEKTKNYWCSWLKKTKKVWCYWLKKTWSCWRIDVTNMWVSTENWRLKSVYRWRWLSCDTGVTVTPGKILPHTVTHCNILQHTAEVWRDSCVTQSRDSDSVGTWLASILHGYSCILGCFSSVCACVRSTHTYIYVFICTYVCIYIRTHVYTYIYMGSLRSVGSIKS